MTGDQIIRSPAEVVIRLCAAAEAVAKNSYSPYSRYRVGAALDAGGETFVGTNVENVSFPAGVCAERLAIGAAVAAGRHQDITAIAIYGSADDGQFAGATAMPCGICLQWLAELTSDAEILICAPGGPRAFRVEQLLCHPFTS